jgi:hypothetical protein
LFLFSSALLDCTDISQKNTLHLGAKIDGNRPILMEIRSDEV